MPKYNVLLYHRPTKKAEETSLEEIKRITRRKTVLKTHDTIKLIKLKWTQKTDTWQNDRTAGTKKAQKASAGQIIKPLRHKKAQKPNAGQNNQTTETKG